METTEHLLIIILCLSYIYLHLFIYALEFKLNYKFLKIENNDTKFRNTIMLFWFVSLLYLWALSSSKPHLTLLMLTMTSFLPLIRIILIITGYLDENIKEILSLKFCLTINIIEHSIIVYSNRQTCFIIFSILLSLIFFISHWNYHFNYYELSPDDIIVDGDIYRLNDDNKTVTLMLKGDTSSIIEKEIVYGGIKHNVAAFDLKCMKRYTNSYIRIENEKFIRYYIVRIRKLFYERIPFKNIVVEYDLSLSDLQVLNRLKLCNHDFLLTSKCISFVQNVNKLFSINLDLHYVERNSSHLLINESCRVIKNAACYKCINLKFISLPSSLEVIEDYAFKNCINLRSVEFRTDSRLKYIGIEAFANTDLRKITFPRSIEKIGHNAFKPCKKLKQARRRNLIDLFEIPKLM